MQWQGVAKISTNGRMVGGKDGTSRHARQTEEFAGAISMYETICNHTMKEFVKKNREAYIKEYSWDTVAERILKVMEEDKRKR